MIQIVFDFLTRGNNNISRVNKWPQVKLTVKMVAADGHFNLPLRFVFRVRVRVSCLLLIITMLTIPFCDVIIKFFI